jgi:hypothetical protein
MNSIHGFFKRRSDARSFAAVSAVALRSSLVNAQGLHRRLPNTGALVGQELQSRVVVRRFIAAVGEAELKPGPGN